MLSIIRSFILIGITLSPVIFAQGIDESSTDKKKTGRRTWLVATSLPEGVKSPVTILAGGKLSEVRLSKRSIGTAVKVPKDGIIQVVKTMVAADGEVFYEILASMMIPEGVRESLIVLVPSAKIKPPLKFQSKVIDLDKFRGGNALFVNLTKLEIGIALGSKKRTIKTGQVEIVDTGEFKGVKNVAVSYHYRSPKEKKWNLISASTVPLRSTLREILIFSYNTKLGQVGYHGMSFHLSK